MKKSKNSVSAVGLTRLYQPEGIEPSVEIVFVHGLQGHPRSTWEYQHRGRTNNENLSPEDATQGNRERFRLSFRWSRSRNARNSRSVDSSDRYHGEAGCESSVYWPLDLLPNDCPNAGILTFGYDTQVTRGYGAADKSSIFAHGRNLLYELSRERDTLGRSLIFVAHSLGGIIVKEALRESEDSDKEHQKDIIKSTVAVMFLGTPHRGSNMAGLGEIAKDVAAVALRFDTNSDILGALSVDSPQLDVCRRSFVRQWNKYNFQVKTFQESKGLTGVNIGRLNDLVVPDVSSSFDDPREDAEKIHANHMDMCRFTGPDDPGYRKVGMELKRFVRDAQSRLHGQRTSRAEATMQVPIAGSSSSSARLLNPHEHANLLPTYGQATLGERSLDPASYDQHDDDRLSSREREQQEELARKEREEKEKEKDACLQSLSFPELGDRERDVNTALTNTCCWLFEDQTYLDWYTTQSDKPHGHISMLWMKGKPGAGKSTLMKEAVRRARERATTDSSTVAGFFFSYRRNVDLERTPLGLFRSLLYQLLQKDTALMEEFLPLFRSKKNQASQEWQWNSNELRDFLRRVFSVERQQHTFIFVDALDECDETSVRDLVYFFRDITTGPTLHVCLSSRHFPLISVPNCPEIRVEDRNQRDIEHYVRATLSPSIPDLSSLEREIVRKASGIFLWVALVVSMVNKDLDDGNTAGDIAETLQKVPAELDELFSRLFKDLNAKERQRAVNLIQWVLLAKRPLTVRELRHAMAFSKGPRLTSLKDWANSRDYIKSDEQFKRFMRTYSRGLVEVKPSGYSLSFFEWVGQRIRGVETQSLSGLLGDILDDERTNSSWEEPSPSQQLSRHLESAFEYLDIQTALLRAWYTESPEYIKMEHLKSDLDSLIQTLGKHEGDFAADNMTALLRPIAEANTFNEAVECFKMMIGHHGQLRTLFQLYLNEKAAGHTVQFIHESVREFFADGPGFSVLDRGTELHLHNLQDHCERHSKLVQACIDYISIQELQPLEDDQPNEFIKSAQTEFRSPRPYDHDVAIAGHRKFFRGEVFSKWQVRNTYAFLDYAVEHLYHHAAEAETGSVTPDALVKALNQEQGRFWKRWGALQYPERFAKDTTPLYASCESHLLLCTMKLLESGFDPNERGGFYCYPIIAAIVNQRFLGLSTEKADYDHKARDPARECPEPIVRLLLEHHADPNAKDISKETALHHAVSVGNPSLVSLLISAGADVQARDSEGRTPLHAAACSLDGDTIDLFLSKGADLQACDLDGNTPLHLAAKYSSTEVVRRLGVGSSLQARNNFGQTPLYAASEIGREEVVRYLVRIEPPADATSGTQTTALHAAAEGGNLNAVKILIKSGINIHALDSNQQTPLHTAARWGHSEIISLLVQSGSDLEAVDRDSQTPLHLAAKSNTIAVTTLLELGANLNAVDKDNRTPLHIAAKDGTGAIVTTLVQSGADTKVVDRNGKFARAYARVHRSVWLDLDDAVMGKL